MAPCWNSSVFQNYCSVDRMPLVHWLAGCIRQSYYTAPLLSRCNQPLEPPKGLETNLQRTNTLFLFYKNHFYKNVEAEICPKFKKMYGLKYEHPQAQPKFTRSYKKKSVSYGDRLALPPNSGSLHKTLRCRHGLSPPPHTILI